MGGGLGGHEGRPQRSACRVGGLTRGPVLTRGRAGQEERQHKKAQYAERARDEREHMQTLQSAIKAAALGGASSAPLIA